MIELINIETIDNTAFAKVQVYLDTKEAILDTIKHSRVNIKYQFPLQELAETFHKNTHTLEGNPNDSDEISFNYRYASSRHLSATHGSFELDGKMYLVDLSITGLNNKIYSTRYTNLSTMLVKSLWSTVPEYVKAYKSLSNSNWNYTKESLFELMMIYKLESRDYLADIASLNFGDLSIQINSLNDIFQLNSGLQTLLINALIEKRKEDILEVVDKVNTIKVWTTVSEYEEFVKSKHLNKYRVSASVMRELSEFRTEEIDNEYLEELFDMMVTSCPNENPTSLNSFLLMIKNYKLSDANLSLLSSLISKAKNSYGGMSANTWLKKVSIVD